MNHRLITVVAALSAVAVLAAACGSDGEPTAVPAPTETPPATTVPSPTPEPTPLPDDPVGILDYDALVEALKAAGVAAPASDMVFPPQYFAVDGRSIVVGGTQDALVPAVVFEFDSPDQRLAAQETVDLGSDTIGEVSISDFDRLAVFGAGKVIVLYQGRDVETIERLAAILGDPFARKTDEGTPDPSASVRKLVNAPIESVELRFLESDPVQVVADIEAALPNGCHREAGAAGHVAGNVFGYTVSNSVPAIDDVACTQQFSTYTVTVTLGAREEAPDQRFPFKSGVAYTLAVNDRVIEFTTNGVTNDEARLAPYDSLLIALARQGVAAQPTSDVISGVFGLDARIIRIGNNEVQAHVFGTETGARAAAGGVSENGTTIELRDGSVISVNWAATPHFFRAGRVIALYVGEDASVVRALIAAAGEPFAGPPSGSTGAAPLPTPAPGDAEPAPFPEPTQLAPIESVDVNVLESFPAQYSLRIVAGLENSCIEPHSVQTVITRPAKGRNVVEVNVLNIVLPPGMVCAQVYRTYEENVNLGSGFESGSEWDVVVNGQVKTTFTAQ